MHRHGSVRNLMGVVAAGSCALSLAAAGSAWAQASGAEVRVAVFAGHYVLAGRTIDDLDVLVDAVGAMRPRSVRLEACGAGTERAQRAAAHRFRHLHMDLRVADPDAPGCQSPDPARSMPVSLRAGQRPYGIDDHAVDQWWHAMMP